MLEQLGSLGGSARVRMLADVEYRAYQKEHCPRQMCPSVIAEVISSKVKTAAAGATSIPSATRTIFGHFCI
jgi:hypothetical protein